MKYEQNFISGVTKKYPESFLDKRVEVEGNVIACIFKSPLILDDITLDESYFLTKDGRFFMNLAMFLKKKNFKSFDELTVMSNATDKILDRLEDYGGYETIRNMAEVANLDNWDTYLDKLYKYNIYCKLHDDGFNLTKRITFNGEEIVPIEFFDKLESREVVEFYESLLTNYEFGTSSKVIESETIDFTDDFLQDCIDGIEQGVDFGWSFNDVDGNQIRCFPFLSEQVSGFLEGTLSFIGGYTNVGKSTMALTPIMSLLSQGRKVLIVTNEEKAAKFKIKILVWILAKRNHYYSLTKKKLSSGIINENDKQQYHDVQKFWRDEIGNNLKIVVVSSSDISVISKEIRSNVLKFGFDTFLYDTFKISENSFGKNRQDLSLVEASRILDMLCKQYNLIGIATVQLATYMKGNLFLDVDCLSNSKQVAEILELIFMMRNVYDEELDPKSKFYCNPFRLKKEDGKWIEETFEPDRSQVWRMLFVPKSRNGATSVDNGVAYLLKFDGAHSTFSESCQCRPKHGHIGGSNGG